jgi:hypothetical protein
MRWTDLADPRYAWPADALALAAEARECDAHALWACLSDFDGYLLLPSSASLPGRPVPVLVELDAQATPQARAAIAAFIGKPSAYDIEANFYTGVVTRDRLPALHALHGVRGWRIGLPVVRDAVGGEAAPACAVAPARAMAAVNLPALDARVPLVGIIDHGIAVAHAAFRQPRGGALPRLVALWDQDPHRCSNGHWDPVAELGYGGELTGATLAGLIADTGDDERRIYERIDYAPVQHLAGHGTHVLDLAAGDPNPLTPPDKTSAHDHAQWSGPASRAGIVAVQLPYKPQKDTSGGGLCVQVLDALHYIVARAQGGHVVINLSDGAYGGPHDGQSMLERAIDAFIDRNPQIVLVLAAGNAHEDRGHACAPALQAGQSQTFRWHVLPADATLSFVEIWFDRELAAGDVSVHFASPAGESRVQVALGDGPRALLDAENRLVGAVIGRLRNPNGVARSMFLLALAPTARVRRERGTAPHGLWRLTVRNDAAAAPVRVDAWIERDTPAINDPGPCCQSVFIDEPGAAPSIDRQRTLGSLAGAEKALVVGSHYRRGTAFSGDDPAAATVVARYSSRGDGRFGAVNGPDLTAPGDESPVSHGLRAAANRSGATVRLQGTSVAAPQVTRRIVNQFAASTGSKLPGSATERMKKRLLPNPNEDPLHDGSRGRLVPGEEPLPAAP